MKTKNVKNPCEKYELAMTDYVLGEEMEISREELFNHLRKCQKCRNYLEDWQDIHTVMQMETYYNTPEGKQKMKAGLEDLRKRLAQPNAVPVHIQKTGIVNTEYEIGTVSGFIWSHLGEIGKVRVDDIVRTSNIPTKIVDRAIGWLAKEKKVCLERDEKAEYVYLTNKEHQIYQAQNGDRGVV